MKKLFFLLTFSAAVLCASASNKYVKPDGDDSLDGKSWANAKATIKPTASSVGNGDTLFIAAGTYNERFSVSDGQTILGGYNPTTGERDIELYPTIIDGTDIGQYVIVKYGGAATSRITIDGLILQNAQHAQWGGGAIYMRYGMTLSNCIIRDCAGGTAGAIYIDNEAVSADLPIVSNCLIEFCSSASCAAIYNNGGIVENCIVRGCVGSAGAIRNETSASITRNCVLYNNSLSGTWPNSAIYNKGIVINCTVCNNYGDQYPGIHSEGTTYNSVFWGNRNPEDMGDPANYINGAASSHNVADEGFGKSSAFISKTLGTVNTAADGPNFRNPTTFIGAPKDASERAAISNADFSLTDASVALLDKADASQATSTDINGVTRPKGDGYDVGAYEYDPNAAMIPVTGVHIQQDTIKVIKGQSGTLIAIVEPANANNKRVNWSIDDPTIATIQNGAVTGLKEDTTVAHVETQEGGFTDFAIVVVLPVPPVKYPDEVVEADALYQIEDYTIPTFIPFLIAKEAARIDSLNPESDLTVIPERIAAMQDAINKLQGKEEPYNMVANINGDPSTRMAFCWFTNDGITNGQVQLIPSANATKEDFETCDCLITFNADATQTPALNYAVATSGIAKATKLPGNTKFTYVSHKALAENLTPGTAYSWRVGYEGHWSEIGHFRTKDAEQGEYSFIYMSDSHIMDAEYVDNARWCATAAAKTAPEAKFCLFPGDFVETGTKSNSEWEWERWFEESIKPVIMQMPIVPTDGNHDDSENLNYDYHFNTDWGFYSMVQSHKPQFHGITYSFVYGDVLFLVYSLQDWWRASGSSATNRTSTYLSNDVKKWFQEQIALHPNTKYRVTLAHKNIFSGSGHSIDDEIPMFRDIMLPILKECEIDLAIQGHDHCYEVIGPVNPDTRTVVEGAVTNVQTVPVNTNTNMTGKEGGTFCTDDGTMYFIGATCGRKRYYPYSRAQMEEMYTTDPSILYDDNHHDVLNYFDLFTSMFGQPGAPSFTKFTVKSDCIEMNSYKADSEGNATLFNTMQVKRTKPHTVPSGYENMSIDTPRDGEKFIRDGQLFIRIDGKIYNVIGQKIAQ
jgi:hypothetical protein